MSRHRSPGGRQQGVASTPRARTAPHPPQHRAIAVRNGMTAAAAGGALAAILPAVAVTGPVPDAAAGEAALRLTTDRQSTPADLRTGVSLVASIVPVREAPEPDQPEFGVDELLKAAGLADVARRVEEARAAREAAARCDVDLDDLGRVRPWVRDAARFLSCLYDQPDLIGVAQRSRHSDHPSGHAIDLMTRGEHGDRIADCALENQDELGISYVIWEQRVNYGDGWERMSDRGGDTENHYDHVHISFERGAPGGDPTAARCS